MINIGKKCWVIAEGYIPSKSNGPQPAMTSHETACMLNVTDKPANVRMVIYFTDKEPVGPYAISVPARRCVHMRFNDLVQPLPIPRDTDFASLLISDVPIIVQHTRLDSRQAENAIMSTIAFAGPD
jgi:hypothetical protein